MRIAIIDLGTNSVRFDVHQLGPAKTVKQLHREKIMVRLGQGAFLSGKLDRGAVRRTLHAFLRFKKIADQYKTGKIIAFGTSALREVSDRDRFLSLVRARCGIQIRVISGAEEAQLIALGILSHEKLDKRPFALVDIGGGSTEVSICRGRKILRSQSFPLGTARLQQVYLKRSPPRSGDIKKLRQYIRGTLSAVIAAQHWPKVHRVLGSSGTIRALAKMVEGSGSKAIQPDRLRNLVKEMSRMTTTELLGVSGMESKRVDMILAGAILFEECMQALGAKAAISTEFSLRDGILEEELRLYQRGDSSHLALHLPDLIEKAARFGASGAHLRRMLRLADELFDALRPVHCLKPGWKLYLEAATILRDTGEAINLSTHEAHSYYIVKNSNFPGADPWETEFIAQLCRQHEGTKIDERGTSGIKGKSRREAFKKLLAMLRIIDALDSGPETHIAIRRVRIARGKVTLQYAGRNLTGLEFLNVERRAPFFHKVMKKPISVMPP